MWLLITAPDRDDTRQDRQQESRATRYARVAPIGVTAPSDGTYGESKIFQDFPTFVY